MNSAVQPEPQQQMRESRIPPEGQERDRSENLRDQNSVSHIRRYREMESTSEIRPEMESIPEDGVNLNQPECFACNSKCFSSLYLSLSELNSRKRPG